MRKAIDIFIVLVFLFASFRAGMALGLREARESDVYVKVYCHGWKDGNSATMPGQYQIDSIEMEKKVHGIWGWY